MNVNVHVIRYKQISIVIVTYIYECEKVRNQYKKKFAEGKN